MLEGQKGWLSTFITACANFSAQYNFQSIAIALLIMSSSVCTSNDDACKDGEQESWVHGTASAVIFAGAVCGQLGMGFLGDYLNRNHALSVTLLLAAISALLSAIIPHGNPTSIYATIIVCRFMLGVGLGGVYPLSATKASEDAAKSGGGKVNSIGACWAFFWQMPGLLGPWFLGYIFTFTSNLSTSMKWRLILGIGCVPSIFAILGLLYEDYSLRRAEKEIESLDNSFLAVDVLRLSVATINRESDTNTAERKSSISYNKLSISVVWESLQDKVIRNDLIACGGSWFLYDVVVYGVNLLGGYIIKEIGEGDDDNVSAQSSVRAVSSKELIALSLGIPAVLFSIYLLPFLGLKYLQFIAYIFMAFMFTLVAALFEYLKHENKHALYGLYCVLCFAMQFGLGICSFSMSAALFPQKIRSTFNGIASAMGKLGAVVGAYALLPIAEASSYSVPLGICAAIALLGAWLTAVYVNLETINNQQEGGQSVRQISYASNSSNNDSYRSFNKELHGTDDSSHISLTAWIWSALSGKPRSGSHVHKSSGSIASSVGGKDHGHTENALNTAAFESAKSQTF